MKLIYFSPTGGTLKAAQQLADSIGEQVEAVDLTQRNLSPLELNESDLAIIAVPSYSGRVPPLALERLKQITGNGAKAVVMAVYGNRAFEDTLIELADAAKELGFKVIAGVSAIAKHSIATQIASDRPDSDDFRILKEFGEKIKGKTAAKDFSEASLPGNRPYRKAGPGLMPKTNKRKCNDCGRCAKECPSGAISMERPGEIDSDVCINCMRCVTICPTGAKHLPKLMLAMVGAMLKKPCASRKEPELFL